MSVNVAKSDLDLNSDAVPLDERNNNETHLSLQTLTKSSAEQSVSEGSKRVIEMDNIEQIRVCNETQDRKACKDQIEALFGDSSLVDGDSGKEETVDDQEKENDILIAGDHGDDQKMESQVVDSTNGESCGVKGGFTRSVEGRDDKIQVSEVNVVKETDVLEGDVGNVGEGIGHDGSQVNQVETLGVVPIDALEASVAEEIQVSGAGDMGVKEEIISDGRCEVKQGETVDPVLDINLSLLDKNQTSLDNNKGKEVIEASSCNSMKDQATGMEFILPNGDGNGDENRDTVTQGTEMSAEDPSNGTVITETESSLVDEKHDRDADLAERCSSLPNGGQILDSQLPDENPDMGAIDRAACGSLLNGGQNMIVTESVDLLPDNLNKDQKAANPVSELDTPILDKTRVTEASDFTPIPEKRENVEAKVAETRGSVIGKDETKDVQVSMSDICIPYEDQTSGGKVQITQTHAKISLSGSEAGSRVPAVEISLPIEGRKGGNIVIDLGSSHVNENRNTSNDVTEMRSKGEISQRVETPVNAKKTKEARSVSSGKKNQTSQFQDQENEFSSADLVWGKVKSHPWWPGQIFEPSDSSEKAIKYQKKDNFLVAYFGDRTFAWCDKTQLKPFRANFGLMERQVSTDTFHSAVDSALYEVSRRVELGLACSCLPESARQSLKCQEVINAGIRKGVTVADGADKSFTVTSFEPNRLLEYIKELALFVTPGGVNRLEFTVVQSQLAAYYHAKGYLKLPQFHVYVGLLNDAEFALPNITCSKNVPQISKVEDQNSMDLDSKNGGRGISGSPSRKRKHILDDVLYHRRKQKSLSELMAEKKARRASKGGIAQAVKRGSSKLVTPSSGTKKHNALIGGSAQAGERVTSKSVSPSIGTVQRRKRKKRKSIASLSDPDIETPTTGRSFKKKRLDLLSDPDCQTPTTQRLFKDDPLSVDSSGDGKKKRIASLGDSEIETPSTRRSFKLGECISRIANQLTGSPPIILRLRRESFRKNAARVERSKTNNKAASNGTVTPRTPESRRRTSIPKETSSPDEMLSQLCLTARDPMKGYNFLSVIIRFFSSFRDSVCQDGSSSGRQKKSQEKTGGKSGRRKSPNSKSHSAETLKHSDMNDSYWTDRIIYSSPEESLQGTPKRKGEFELQNPTKKQNRQSPSWKPVSSTSKLDTEQEAVAEKQVINSGEKNDKSSPTALILTFNEGDSLPSEPDLCKIFSRYGALKESETEVLRKTNRARVVFERRSDAEVAFSSAGKFSIFGPALVSYRLRYLSSPSNASSTKQSRKDGASMDRQT